MKLLFACLAFTLMACGSKAKPAAPPANTSPATGSAAPCCCLLADKSAKMQTPDECTAGGGTCEATEDSCHGIDEPVP